MKYQLWCTTKTFCMCANYLWHLLLQTKVTSNKTNKNWHIYDLETCALKTERLVFKGALIGNSVVYIKTQLWWAFPTIVMAPTWTWTGIVYTFEKHFQSFFSRDEQQTVKGLVPKDFWLALRREHHQTSIAMDVQNLTEF